MGGMFYSLQEAAKKLNKTEDQLKQIIKQGKLREFRDGPNLLLKIEEVEALALEEGISLEEAKTPDLSEPQLQVSEPQPAESQPSEKIEPSELEPEPEEAAKISEFEPEPQGLEMPDLEKEELLLDESDMEFSELEGLDLKEESPESKQDRPSEPETPAAEISESKAPPVKATVTTVKATRVQKFSAWQWFTDGLRQDRASAVIVLCILICLIIGLCAAAVYAVFQIKSYLL